MKKLILLLLALMLCLAGCANVDGDLTESTPVETLPAGYYHSGSDIESKTDGAVRVYTLPDGQYSWIAMAGDRLMLLSGEKTSRLCLISGNEGVPVAELELDSVMLETCQPLFNGFAYYDPKANEAVFLDLQLQKAQTIALPKEIVGKPVFADDGRQIFFCVGNEIRAIEVERKLNRLIKSVSSGKISLGASYFNGEIINCAIEYDDGKTDKVYISAKSGQTLNTNLNIQSVDTSGNNYVVTRNEGVVFQVLTGEWNKEPKLLALPDGKIIGVPELGGVVGSNAGDNLLTLNYYDTNTGKKTASVTIPGISETTTIVGDKWGNCLWALATKDNSQILLRWDLKASAVKDEATYTETFYTSENPDTASLERINERVEALNKKYGVRIRVWEDAVKYTGNHDIVPEYQAPVISAMLDELEPTLAEFPKNFISKSISSKVRICLVRSIDGQQTGTQFWVDDYAFISIAAGADVRSEFLKGFGHVVDSHVLGNSPVYDYWKDLNPKDFGYGQTADEKLTTGDNRAFYDVESMKTGTIDRSRIFWQAMLPDNADMFQSKTMQAKLKMVCKGIRDAWRLEREEEEYPWEQYLNESIAYKKK